MDIICTLECTELFHELYYSHRVRCAGYLVEDCSQDSVGTVGNSGPCHWAAGLADVGAILMGIPGFGSDDPMIALCRFQ